MAIGKSDSVHYQNIADSIRRNLSGAEGGNAVYFPAEMAGGVNAVAEHNYQKGYKDGGGGAVSNGERFIKTVYGIEKNVSVNEAVDQAISDFNAIKLELGNRGAVVSDIEPTENYPGKIVEVYDKGAEAGYSSGKEAGITEGFETGKQAGIAEGYNTGKAEGYNSGYQIGKVDGKTEVYTQIEPINTQLENTLNGTDTGGKSYYDEFWDMFQDYGKRVFYGHAFRNSSFEYIRPKYKVRVSERNSASNLFYYSVSLKKVEAEYFDFSQLPFGLYSSEGLSGTFSTCSALTEIEDVGLSPSICYVQTFAWCPNLKTIAKITVDENTAYSNTFNNCFALENLTIEGTIGQDGFNVQWSTKLSKASIISIINALSTTASGKSVTLSKVAVESAFGSTESEEWISLINARSNWTINLV